MSLEKLRKYCRDSKGKPRLSIVVGYAQNYALEQHERTDYNHKVGQAKFLEEAARLNEPVIRNMVRSSGINNLADSLLRGGLLIQRESQQLVPVDTSALKASAFTCIQEELDEVANSAHQQSEIVRKSVLKERDE